MQTDVSVYNLKIYKFGVFLIQLVLMFLSVGYFYNANRVVSKFAGILWSLGSFILWIVSSYYIVGDYDLLFIVFLQIALISLNYFYLHKFEHEKLVLRIERISYDDFSKNFIFNYSLSKQTIKELSIRIFDSNDNFLYDTLINNKFKGSYEVSFPAENFGSANYYATIGYTGTTKIMDKRNFAYVKNSRVSLF